MSATTIQDVLAYLAGSPIMRPDATAGKSSTRLQTGVDCHTCNDHVTPYLTTILGFVGITDVSIVHIGPTFFGEEATRHA